LLIQVEGANETQTGHPAQPACSLLVGQQLMEIIQTTAQKIIGPTTRVTPRQYVTVMVARISMAGRQASIFEVDAKQGIIMQSRPQAFCIITA
jgi:hypothetical protein